MSRPRRKLIGICLGLGLGLYAGCDDASNSPQINGKTNVCTDYSTCDECIAGQQDRGHPKAEAETMCGAAVVGCFTRWDKPIRCGGKAMDEDDASQE